MELSIVMPCLNEEQTVGICIDKALASLAEMDIEGEVVIADNNSTDHSREVAERHGARVVRVADKGYGAALIGGIRAAEGTYVIMGDADDSYDFSNLKPFVEQLRDGFSLVLGNRFKGGIEPGAMPPLHRYLGNPILSFLGRLFFRASVGDFHCGLRGFNRQRMLELDLNCRGMEFASEMVVKASLANYRISEVPTTLQPDGRDRAPHLNSWRDGWRHLRFLLLFSPRWLFFYPGLLAFLVGILLTTALGIRPIQVGDVTVRCTQLAVCHRDNDYRTTNGFFRSTDSIDRFGVSPATRVIQQTIVLFYPGKRYRPGHTRYCRRPFLVGKRGLAVGSGRFLQSGSTSHNAPYDSSCRYVDFRHTDHYFQLLFERNSVVHGIAFT